MHSPAPLSDAVRHATHFDDERANHYDRVSEGWAPMRDAMLLFLQVALGNEEMPPDARVLCVGVGTGTEMLHLAQRFPGWRFVAVEPAPGMMRVCREKMRQAGIEDRCEFHQGYLETLAGGHDSFDAATCLLVSHFLMNRSKRAHFFQGIAGRLKPGGLLVHSDLTGDMQEPEYWRIRPLWIRLLMHAGIEGENLEGFVAAHGTTVDLLSPKQTRELLRASDFVETTAIYQCLYVHGWLSRRAQTRSDQGV